MMTSNNTSNKTTYFAPAERTGKEQIESERKTVAEYILKDPFARKILGSVMEVVLILDRNRQVVFTNEALHKLLGVKEDRAFLGLRLGELFKCVHADEMMGGCGTSEHCRMCGAVIAILSAQEGKPRSEECTIVQRDTNNAIDLAVSAVPFDVGGERYTLFIMLDISDQKRREAMERIFFHDVMNISGVISGLSEMLQLGKADKFPDLGKRIFKATRRLIEEIDMQRSLTLAEMGELQPRVEHIHAQQILKDSVDAYSSHPVANGKKLDVDASSEDVEFDSDAILLNRVIGNMIKNALEASEKGEQIKVGCRRKDGAVEFWVHNDAVMSKDVQIQVFRRSYTTKGKGRGLGTYGMKLLSERYLKGQVDFESSKGKGTTFFARYPA